ncbi:uncharacterized protein LOC144860792 [Branchiostoma floridae x Branchiostoma japonicum]
MWSFMLFFSALIVWPDSSRGQEYLTTVDTWSFFKVQASGQMTNANVKATCEAAGMRYPCHTSGRHDCPGWWVSGCIAYDDGGVSCRETHYILSVNLCGTTDYRQCQPLDDTFAYIPGWRSDDSAFGVDYQTHTHGLHGADYNNKYALCADMDECSSAPCRNGATCQDGVNSFTCQCAPGFNGSLCETDINECSSAPCQNGATCQDGVNSFTCQCAPGFTGTLCETGQEYLTTVDTWSFFKVQASGQMTSANVKATCEAAGMRYPCFWSGGHGCTDSLYWASGCITYDDVRVSCGTHWVLSAKLCGNTNYMYCQPLDDTFVYCPSCWSNDHISAWGVDYDTHTSTLHGADYSNMYALCADVDDCASSPCTHGSCTDGVGSYTCSCENGWEGADCDQNMDDCASNPCWFGGTCVDGFRDFSCVCLKGFAGKKCEIAAFSGQCYQFSPDALSHPEAQQACSTNNGRLVDVKDAHQHIFLTDGMTTTTGASNWLGMKLEYTLKNSDGSANQGFLQSLPCL